MSVKIEQSWKRVLESEFQKEYMLWGNYAKRKGEKIDRNKHLVLEASHPSPFSAYNGFFDCRHFSQANKYLKSKGKKEIDWK